jgi:DNA-binding NarL/FixJ family response regulator
MALTPVWEALLWCREVIAVNGFIDGWSMSDELHAYLTAQAWNELEPMERQVAELAGQGMTNRQIADELGIDRETVKSSAWSIMRKLVISRNVIH